tara:strand:- start:917 stop:1549 length:633 start_codon:yes stop_codon:yes gene_type:complete
VAKATQSVSLDELTDISSQCCALHEDWHRFYQLASHSDKGDQSQIQLTFIQLQSRLSCDYPILSHWRKGSFGLASSIGKLVAQAGTLDTLSREVRAGDGPLVREWQSVNESIGRVRKLLEGARLAAKKGRPITLPEEIALPKERQPFPFDVWKRRCRYVALVLVVCLVLLIVFRPVALESSLLRWLDQAYTAWQLRSGIDGLQFIPPSSS